MHEVLVELPSHSLVANDGKLCLHLLTCVCGARNHSHNEVPRLQVKIRLHLHSAGDSNYSNTCIKKDFL